MAPKAEKKPAAKKVAVKKAEGGKKKKSSSTETYKVRGLCGGGMSPQPLAAARPVSVPHQQVRPLCRPA